MANKKIYILYVDDNPENLVSFKASFRRDYNVVTAESAAEGLERLEEQKFQIIFADQRMPKMTGAEFFEKILPRYNTAIRILLTGYADINAVIDAVNKGNIYRYVSKPWKEEDIRMTIENAYEIYQAREMLKRKNIELQQSYDELDKFVYSASHDLTAPLSSIQGIIRLAREDKEDAPEYIEMIDKSVKKLGHFVQNILDYHRNKKSLEQEESIDLQQMAHETIENFRFFDPTGTTTFSEDIQTDIPFVSDKYRLQIILNNLISNAIKFQDDTKKEKRVEVRGVISKEKCLLEVEDNGIGIPENHYNQIFEMYIRANNSRSGSGVGLYIVKEVLDKLNGDITFESEVGKGTTFKVEIPNKADD